MFFGFTFDYDTKYGSGDIKKGGNNFPFHDRLLMLRLHKNIHKSTFPVKGFGLTDGRKYTIFIFTRRLYERKGIHEEGFPMFCQERV